MSEQGYVHKPYELPSLLEVHQQSFAAGAASRDTEVRELREKLEAAERSAMHMINQRDHIIRKHLATIARVEALAESVNASDKWHDVAPMIRGALAGPSPAALRAEADRINEETGDETTAILLHGEAARMQYNALHSAPVVPVPPEEG